MKQVKVYDDVNNMLEELVAIYKEQGKREATKQSVVNALIIKAHKKECK
jgi:hypothetical protein